MKYSVRIVFLALAAAALLAAQGPGFGGHERGFGFGLIGPAGRTPVTGVPYSAVEVRVSTETLSDGNQIQHQEQTLVYRDSQGRVRYETTAPAMNGHPAHTFVEIFDPVAGNVVRLDSEHQTAMVSPVRTPNAQNAAGTHAAMARRFGDSTGTSEDLAPVTISDRPATVTRTTHTIPAGAIGNQQAIAVTRTVYMSPEVWYNHHDADQHCAGGTQRRAVPDPVRIRREDDARGPSWRQGTATERIADPNPGGWHSHTLCSVDVTLGVGESDPEQLAAEFERLSRLTDGDSQGWKFDREELHERQ